MAKKQKDTQSEKASKKQAKQQRRWYKRWWAILLFIFVVLAALTGGAAAAGWQFQESYAQRMYPGVSVGDIDVSGMTYLEALDAVEASVNELTEETLQLTLRVDNETTVRIELPSYLTPTEASGNERLLYTYDVEASVDAAYAIGRDQDPLTNWKQQWWAWQNGRTIQPDLIVDHDAIEEVLALSFEEYEQPAQDANISIDANGELTITPEEIGTVLDYDAALEEIVAALQDISTTALTLEMEQEAPVLTAADIEQREDEVRAVLERAPIALNWETDGDGTRWDFEQSEVGTWLVFEDEEIVVSPKKLDVSLDSAGVHDTVDIEPHEARWRVVTSEEDGTLQEIVELTTANNGRTVDVEATATAITEWLHGSKASGSTSNEGENEAISLVVTEKEPNVTPDNVNELGIKDLLGTGHSDMTGSPYNRRVNIDRGIELLNGLLIAPGEEFSLLETLKPFTLANGYVAELVIKGNETIPEIGGGLCQIGSTTFRAAMESGLDITERRNHSYAVSYYFDDRNNLPGTDATIYDSSPDFQFLNDTDNYILVQARRDNNMLYFDFWGESDGRNAYFTAPTISGWISPPPTKYVETDTLAPGQQNCTESAHAGTTASFDYIIERPDGETDTETFTSVYKPWQAVCLVGKEEEKVEEKVEEAPAEEVSEETVEEQANSEEETTSKKKKKKKD